MIICARKIEGWKFVLLRWGGKGGDQVNKADEVDRAYRVYKVMRFMRNEVKRFIGFIRLAGGVFNILCHTEVSSQ